MSSWGLTYATRRVSSAQQTYVRAGISSIRARWCSWSSAASEAVEAGPWRCRPRSLCRRARDGALQAPVVSVAHAVVCAGLHQRDDLVVRKRPAVHHHAWSIHRLAQDLEHPLRRQHRVRVEGHHQVARLTRQPTDVLLARGEGQGGLVAAPFEIRGETRGRALRIDHGHDPQRLSHPDTPSVLPERAQDTPTLVRNYTPYE